MSRSPELAEQEQSLFEMFELLSLKFRIWAIFKFKNSNTSDRSGEQNTRDFRCFLIFKFLLLLNIHTLEFFALEFPNSLLEFFWRIPCSCVRLITRQFHPDSSSASQHTLPLNSVSHRKNFCRAHLNLNTPIKTPKQRDSACSPVTIRFDNQFVAVCLASLAFQLASRLTQIYSDSFWSDSYPFTDSNRNAPGRRPVRGVWRIDTTEPRLPKEHSTTAATQPVLAGLHLFQHIRYSDQCSARGLCAQQNA